jgi:hypothetical protein
MRLPTLTTEHVIAARHELARRDLHAAIASLAAALGGYGFDAVGGLVARLEAGELTAADERALASLDTVAADWCFGSVGAFLRTVAHIDALT